MNRTVSVRITGDVQGVGYRAWTQATARDLGLTGWVRNEPDGAVTALFQGPREAVDRMVTACHQGPGAASVTQVLAEETRHQDRASFEIEG